MRFAMLGGALLVAGLVLSGTADAKVPAYKILDQIAGPEGAWLFATIDADKRRLYVGRTDGILAVDMQTRKATPLPQDGQRIRGVVAIPGTEWVLGVKDKTNTAALIHGETGAVRAEVPVGRRPETAALDTSSGLVAVMAGSAEVTLVDPKAATAVGSIPVAGILEAGATDGKGKLFINLEDKNQIAVVDIAGKKQVGAYDLPGCKEPTGLGYDAKNNILISACHNKAVKLIDAATGADRGTLQVTGATDVVLVDDARKVAFIPCSDGHMAVLDLSGALPTLAASVPSAQGAITGAVDPKTGNVYLPVGRAAATSFSKAIPGFAVLVLGTK